MKFLAPAEQLCIRTPLIKLCVAGRKLRSKEVGCQMYAAAPKFHFMDNFWSLILWKVAMCIFLHFSSYMNMFFLQIHRNLQNSRSLVDDESIQSTTNESTKDSRKIWLRLLRVCLFFKWKIKKCGELLTRHPRQFLIKNAKS